MIKGAEESTQSSFGVPAVYRSVEKFPEFVGNPLIEGLPPIIDHRTAMKMMSYRPYFNENERNEPKEVRAHYIKRLARLVQPVDSHMMIEQAISINLRYGYVTKNPLIPAIVQHQHYLREKGGDGVELPPIEFIPSAMFLTGYSGIGKTTLLNAILRRYPQLIVHSMYHGRPFEKKQITYLKLCLQHNASIKSLCKGIISEVGRLVEADYEEQYKRASVEDLIQAAEMLSSRYCLGLLVIDELQQLAAIKGDAGKTTLRFFENLMNKVGVPIILVGTFSALKLFGDTIRHGRRVTGNVESELRRPYPGSKPWQLLSKRVWSYQWLKNPEPFGSTITDLLYDLSQGITDILVKLLMCGQWRALNQGKETLDEALLKEVMDNELDLLKPALAALRSGKQRMMKKFDDMLPKDNRIEERMNQLFELTAGDLAYQEIVSEELQKMDQPAQERPTPPC